MPGITQSGIKLIGQKKIARFGTFPDINHCGTAIYLYICKLTGVSPANYILPKRRSVMLIL